MPDGLKGKRLPRESTDQRCPEAASAAQMLVLSLHGILDNKQISHQRLKTRKKII